MEKGVSDEKIAEYVRENRQLLLTNDADFLDTSRYPDIHVLYYSYSEASTYDLARYVDEALSYYSGYGSLPRTIYLD